MKFTVHENFNDMSLEDMLKTLHLPKKELHLLRMSKDIRINDETKPLNTVVQTGDTVLLRPKRKKASTNRVTEHVKYYMKTAISPCFLNRAALRRIQTSCMKPTLF